jgi:hypothetical protein
VGHDDIGIAINRRKIETDVVDDLDTATAHEWSYSLYPALSALREHVDRSTGQRRSEMTKFLMSIGSRAVRLTIHMGDWIELDLSTTVEEKSDTDRADFQKSDTEQGPLDVCRRARSTIILTTPVLEAMHATGRATQFDTYSDFINVVDIRLSLTFDCISRVKEDSIGKLPTSKTNSRRIRRHTNNQRKIWNPEVELGD